MDKWSWRDQEVSNNHLTLVTISYSNTSWIR